LLISYKLLFSNQIYKIMKIILSKQKQFNLSSLGYPSRIVDEDLFLWFQRVQSQQNTIVQLAKNDAVANGHFDEAKKVITEAAANVLIVERVSIWLLSDKSELHCVDLYERSADHHSNGMSFNAEDYPNYFHALENGRAIDVYDALTDHRTARFASNYLLPNNVKSVLNAAIRVKGKTVGVVCHEHVGKARKWSSDEINFAGEIADQVAQVLIHYKRNQAEESLKRAHDHLEKRVKERTLELVEEIAERKKAQANERELHVKLLQAEKLSALGLLAAGVAHELNSPLAGLLSLLRTYKKRYSPHSEDHKIISEMLISSEHMAKIVKDLNQFSKASEDERTFVDLIDVIETTLSFSQYQLINGNIKIVKNYAVHLPPVFGNKSQLQQVVLNVLTNGRDAMANGGVMTIKLQHDEAHHCVVLTFSDTGMGIPKENLSRIFDPFFTTKPRGKGTGLGLSVSHGIIESHKGEMTVDSEVDKGTSFTIRLPTLTTEALNKRMGSLHEQG